MVAIPSRKPFSTACSQPNIRATRAPTGATQARARPAPSRVVDYGGSGRYGRSSDVRDDLGVQHSRPERAVQPGGTILVVDSGRPPHVRRFEDVREFLDWVSAAGQAVRAASLTGVGSSALGSVAFAWNISTALDEPVAAIVPGYGVADVIRQALGGWFGQAILCLPGFAWQLILSLLAGAGGILGPWHSSYGGDPLIRSTAAAPIGG